MKKTDSGDAEGAVPYNRFFELCGKAFNRHGDILDLAVGKHPYEYVGEQYETRYAGGRILDFGCGAKKPLQAHLGLSDEFYYSCDSDPTGEFSYGEPTDIPGDELFDIITANQVFEHLPFDDGIRIAGILARHVRPGGILEIGVPNPRHPTRYLSSPVHVTPWNYLNLCALMELEGLDPFYCARHHKHARLRWFIRPLVNQICRIFMMDWCDTIYVVGRKLES